MIIYLLKKLLLSLKSNYINYVYNLKLISVKLLFILLNIKIRLIINDYIFINILDIKYIYKV